MTGAVLGETVCGLLEAAGAPPDVSLLDRFAATRDESAFAALVRRHGPMVLGVCRRVAGSRHDAEDAFQVTFMELARQAGSVGRRGPLAAWLCRVAYRAARRARGKPLAPLPVSLAASSECDPTPPELDEELDRLPALYREPLVLVYLYGLSNAEAAASLGCPVGTVFTRLSRGRDRLRAALSRRGVGALPVLVPAVVPPALAGRVVMSALSAQTSGVLAGIGGAIVFNKVKAVAAVLLIASAVAAGVVLPSRPPVVPAKARRAAPPPAGEPLPEGALARLGSAKFRHAGLSAFVSLPGGKSVLTSGTDGLLRTWDLSTGEQVRAVRLEGAGETTDASLSADGRWAAAYVKRKVILWDAATGERRKTLTGPKGSCECLSFSDDGRKLAAWTSTWLDLHDLAKGTVRTVACPERGDRHTSGHGRFSPDGKHLILGGGTDEALYIYDVPRGKELHRLRNPHALGSVFSPDGKSFIVSSYLDDKGEVEASIRVYDVASGKPLERVTKGISGVYTDLIRSRDGKTLLCPGSRTACVRDARTFALLREVEGSLDRPQYSLDGKKILSTNSRRLVLREASTGEEIGKSEDDFSTDPALAVSPDGRLLASGGWGDEAILLWDLKTGRIVRRLPQGAKKQHPLDLTFSPDGKTLEVPQSPGYIQTWDVASGKEIRSEEMVNPAGPKEVSGVCYTFLLSPDGKTVSTLDRFIIDARHPTRLRLWDRKTSKCLHETILPGTFARGAWRPDGLAVALPLAEGLTLLDVKTGTPIWKTARAVQKPVHASPDFRLIVARKAQTTVAVWEAATGKEVASLDVGTFAHAALGPDDRTLVLTDATSLRVVDLASGQVILSHPLLIVMRTAAGATYVTALALTPDGRRAFTSHADGTGIVWDVGWKRPARTATGKELAGWWDDLASADAGRAWRAAWALTDAKATAFLEKKLRPAPAHDVALIALIAGLDADTFAEREAAEKALTKLGAMIVPALRVARSKASSAEARKRLDRLLEPHGRFTAEELQRLRAADVLTALEGK